MLTSGFKGSPFKSGGTVTMTTGLEDVIKYRKVTDKKMKKDYFNTVELDPKPYSFRAPNNVKKVPAEVFPDEYAIMVPDGFLVPRKKRGAVYIMF